MLVKIIWWKSFYPEPPPNKTVDKTNAGSSNVHLDISVDLIRAVAGD